MLPRGVARGDATASLLRTGTRHDAAATHP